MTIELAKAKQILVSKIGDMLVDDDLQSFLSSVLSALSLKLEDAPSDGKQYSREDGSWSEVVIPTPDVTEAPVDGKQYVRQDASWEEVSIPSQGVEEAPADGKTYGRKDADWVEVTGGGGSSPDIVRLDIFTAGEDDLHPSNFPVQLGEKAAFFGLCYEIVAAEGFENAGTYYTYFNSTSPTFTKVVQTIDGEYVKFIRTGEMRLDGSTTVYDLSEWRAYSVPFSAAVNSENLVPNVTTTLSSLSAMVTVNVSNATAEVTVTSDSKTILRWTPISSSDTHTFTFANLPSAQVTIGSSGSFVIDSSWMTI